MTYSTLTSTKEEMKPMVLRVSVNYGQRSLTCIRKVLQLKWYLYNKKMSVKRKQDQESE